MPTLLAGLLAVLAAHAAGVGLDFVASVRYPFELDYGEGIVWQQAALIPGPRMYAPGQDLPFIVFHYPPLYHLLARAMTSVQPDFLAAGRLASAVCTLLIAPLVAALVLAQVRRRPLAAVDVAIAVAAGLLVLCLHVVRFWGPLMRVDMLAVMLGLAGVLVGAWAGGRFWGTTLALLICVAAVFTKQTQLPAGAAVFLVALLRNPRGALGAAALAGGVGLGALGLMQGLTGGGFLQHIVGYNLNRFATDRPYWVFRSERSSFPFMAVMLLAAGALLAGLLRAGLLQAGRWRQTDRAATARAMLLLHFTFATLMLLNLFKSGSSSNYLLDCLCVGCALIGALLADLAASPRRFAWVTSALLLGVLLLGALNLPFRQVPDRFPQETIDRQAALVQRIAEAGKPVASEDMTLLMRAGKPVVFEPSIVTELASVGRWNEGPLVRMIRSGGFAFMITTYDTPGTTYRRSAAVDAAMRQAYPRVERLGPELYLHLPPG